MKAVVKIGKETTTHANIYVNVHTENENLLPRNLIRSQKLFENITYIKSFRIHIYRTPLTQYLFIKALECAAAATITVNIFAVAVLFKENY